MNTVYICMICFLFRRYTCQGLIGQEIRQDTVYVTVCNVPNEISSLSSVLEGNSSEEILHQTNVVCTHVTVIESGNKYSDNNGKSLLRATLKLHISPQFNLDNDRGKDKKATIWNYKCLTLNEDQCETSNDKFLVNVEWISREERTFTEKSTGQSQKQVDVYTGDCASLNLKTNSKCNDNIKIYLTNHMSKVLYLKHFNRTTAETFLCHIYKADNLEEITTVTAEHADIDFKQLTYAFGGIAAFLVAILVFAGAVIKSMTLKTNRQRPTNNLPRPVERKRSIEEEHKHNEDMVHGNLDITNSVNHHSVDWRNCNRGRNSRSNPTLSGNASAYYQFNVSRNSNTETINEQKTVSVNSTDNYLNNSCETDTDSAVNQYVNTNLMNTYEQLEKNTTTDIQTYEDVSYDY